MEENKPPENGSGPLKLSQRLGGLILLIAVLLILFWFLCMPALERQGVDMSGVRGTVDHWLQQGTGKVNEAIGAATGRVTELTGTAEDGGEPEVTAAEEDGVVDISDSVPEMPPEEKIAEPEITPENGSPGEPDNAENETAGEWMDPDGGVLDYGAYQLIEE